MNIIRKEIPVLDLKSSVFPQIASASKNHRSETFLKTNECHFLPKIYYSDKSKTKSLENEEQPEIIMAAMEGNTELVKSLTSRNLQLVEKTDKLKNTALTWAALYGHAEILKILIKNGANVNNCDRSKSTALMGSSINGHVEIVKILIDEGKYNEMLLINVR